MKILFITSECIPFVKTGGLADVSGTLPKTLAEKGEEVCVLLPKYRDIDEQYKSKMHHLTHFYVNLGWRKQYCGIDMLEMDNVKYYFMDNQYYFGRDSIYGSGQEEGERFGFFCRCAMEMLRHLNYKPDILHCNDWQTGMIPYLLMTQYSKFEEYKGIKTIFTIHNLRYQGVFSYSYISDILGIDEGHYRPDMLEFYGGINFLKAGIVFSDYITTVSPTYANEIQTPYFGEKLDGLLSARNNSLQGIINGICAQEYDPSNDMWLTAHFSASDTSGKKACKADLQRELGLQVRDDMPIVCLISRLCDQKGLDLIECVLDDIMKRDVQLVILGKGDEHYQDIFSWAAWRYGGRMAVRIELNNALSHRLYAASDIFLMPSLFEPCGLSQMICMRYGTVPIVRETGGLKDTVIPYNAFTGEGTGFSFANYNAHEMLHILDNAIDLYADKKAWSAMMQRCMAYDFSWSRSAESYLELYKKALIEKVNPVKSLVANVAALVKQSASAIKDKAEEDAQSAKQAVQKVSKDAKEKADKAGRRTRKTAEKAKEETTKVTKKIKEGAEKAADKAKDAADKTRRSTRKAAKDIEDKVMDAVEAVDEAVKKARSKIKNTDDTEI